MAGQRRGDVARAALIAHAERLFAEQGIAAVSLRDVSAAAGQRNHSAAQYHFGDRRGLVAAVYEARMHEVDRRRHARLAEIDESGLDGDLEALVEAAVLPLLDVVAESDGWYARFLARTRWDPQAWAVVVSLSTFTSFATVGARLDDAMRDLPKNIRRHRFDQLLTLVVGTLAGWEGAPDRGEPRLGRRVVADELVTACVSVLTAASTRSTNRSPASAGVSA